MLLMRRFLRENTCKTQLGAKFGASRVKSMFRYCTNVGERDNGVSGFVLVSLVLNRRPQTTTPGLYLFTLYRHSVERGVEGYSYSLVENGTVIYS